MTGKTIIPQDQATPARIWGEHRASCVAVKVFTLISFILINHHGIGIGKTRPGSAHARLLRRGGGGGVSSRRNDFVRLLPEAARVLLRLQKS
jgi:hypothetical protein